MERPMPLSRPEEIQDQSLSVHVTEPVLTAESLAESVESSRSAGLEVPAAASKFRGKCADGEWCSFSCLNDEPCLRSNYAARVVAERAAKATRA